MQAEIDSLETLRPIQILGVNRIGLESSNGGMTVGRVLPWLQPKTGQDVWTLWEVEFRDVVILGTGNERLGIFNVSANDLSDPVSYTALTDQLVEAANEQHVFNGFP